MITLVSLNSTYVFFAQTHAFATGNVSSADALPEFSVFRGTSTTAAISSTMAFCDSTGWYQGILNVTTANTFQGGDYCTIQIRATVSGVLARTVRGFRVCSSTSTFLGVNTQTVTDGAVGNAALATGAIGSSQLAAGAITNAAIATGAIGSSQIAAGAIVNAALATGCIGSSQLAAGAIVNAALATGCIGSSQLAAGAISAPAIASSAIGSSQIAAGALTAAKFAAGADVTFPPAATATPMAKIDALYARAFNPQTFNSSDGFIRVLNIAGSSTKGACVVSYSTTTFVTAFSSWSSST